MSGIQIFIGGYMHSGTTLLYKILKRHRGLYGFGRETRFFERLPDYERRLNGCLTSAARVDFACSLAESLTLPDADLSYLRENVEQFSMTSAVSLFDSMCESLCRRHNRMGWVEKTPTNIFFLKEIVNSFPKSKIILVYRDFRDVLASKKKRTLTVESGRYRGDEIAFKKLEKDWNVIADAFSWNKSIGAQWRGVERFPENVFAISYEEFVMDSEDGLRRVLDFIGIERDDNCLNITFSNSAAVEDKIKSTRKGIYSSSVGVWRDELSKGEILLGTYLTKANLQSLGYNVDKSSRTGFVVIIWSFLLTLPGILKRIYKRIKMLGWNDSVKFARNFVRRFRIG